MAALSSSASVLSSGRLGPVSRRSVAVAAAAVQSHVALSGPLLPARLSSGRPAPVLRGSVPPVLRSGAFAAEFASVRFFRSTCGCWVLSGLPLPFFRYVSASLPSAGCVVVASGCGGPVPSFLGRFLGSACGRGFFLPLVSPG